MEMKEQKTTIVVGLGEVGRPLLQLISKYRKAVGVDITPPAEPIGAVDVLHICFPFEIRDFVGESARYIERYRPELTVVNSTVAVGTTRAIAERTGTAVVNSPIRGKHARMLEELQAYVKYIGAVDEKAARMAEEHFQSCGLKTRTLASLEATELAKLTETTYFGLMIAWAQEIERYCDQFGLDYEEVVSFFDEIKFFPRVKYFPGVIGGHCVVPNIEILSKGRQSELLKAIVSSNTQKVEREQAKGNACSKAELGAAVRSHG
jgi:UDP-N-acetyl-D-mannosaminuronate dehydrogenase